MSYTFTKENDTFNAIQNLVGGNLSGRGDGTNMSYDDGQTPPTQSEIDAEITRLQAEYDAQDYARKRKAEYPSIEECVHAILDDDLENLQILRQAVKAKYSKP